MQDHESQGYFDAQVSPFLFHILNFLLLIFSCQWGPVGSRFSISLLAGTVVSACRAGEFLTTAAGGCSWAEGYPSLSHRFASCLLVTHGFQYIICWLQRCDKSPGIFGSHPICKKTWSLAGIFISLFNIWKASSVFFTNICALYWCSYHFPCLPFLSYLISVCIILTPYFFFSISS